MYERNVADFRWKRWHGDVILLFILILLAVTFVAADSEESDGDVSYGSVPDPYGTVYIITSEIEDGSTFYVVSSGSIWIGSDLGEDSFVASELEAAGLTYDPDDGTITGTAADDCTLTVDGKSFSIVVVQPSYGSDASDYPIYAPSYREEYTLDLEKHVGDTVDERFEITFEPDYNYTISTYQDYDFDRADISFDVDHESNGWTSTYYLTVTGTVRQPMTFDYQVTLTQMDIETHYIHYVVLTGHVDFYFLVTYYPGTGTLPSEDTVVRYNNGGELILPLPQAEPGWHFIGWFSDSTAGSDFIGMNGDSVYSIYPAPDHDINLYARYERDSNPMVDINITGSSTVGVGETITLTATAVLADDDDFSDPEKRYVYWEVVYNSQCVRTSGANSTETGGVIDVTGVSEGTVTIRAYAANNSTVDGEVTEKFFQITVTDTPTVEYNEFTLRYVSLISGATNMPGSYSERPTETNHRTTVSSLTPQRTGYEFRGWSFERTATGTTDATSTGNIQPDYVQNSSITLEPGTNVLYALWEKISTKWTVNFVVSPGIGGPSPDSFPVSGTVTSYTLPGPEENPTYPDGSMEFSGWARSAGGTVVAYPGSTITLYSSNTTFYAVWQPVEEMNTFIIHYESVGDAQVPPDSSPYYSENDTFEGTVSTETPQRDRYVFFGWSRSAYWNEGMEYYIEGGSITLSPGTTTLYAIWIQNTYTITFNPNGGTGGPGSVGDRGGSDITVIIPTQPIPERDNYDFLGWSEDPNATEPDDDYAGGKQVTISRNIILYAVWQYNEAVDPSDEVEYITVYVVGDDVTNAPDPLRQTTIGDSTGANVLISDRIPSRGEGWTFLGWSDVQGSEASPRWEAGRTYWFEQRITYLYPVWEMEVGTWTLTFNANGGVGPVPHMLSGVPEDGALEFTIPDQPVPTWTGHTFQGWSIDRNATRVEVDVSEGPATFISREQEEVLYAVWTEGSNDIFTLEFNANGGTGGPGPLTGEDVGSHRFTIPLTYPTREGYIFEGWADGSGEIVAYVGGSYVASSTEATLHASWVEIDNTYHDFNVYFQPYSGADPIATISQSVGATATHTLLTVNQIPERVGYDFLGWSETEGGTLIDGTTYTTGAMNVVLYGVWTSNSSTLPTAKIDYRIDGLTVHFDGTGSYNASSWVWNVDGTAYGISSFDHTFPGSGTYYVELTVYNGNVSDRTGLWITVEDDSQPILLYVGIVLIVIVLVVVVLRYQGVF